MQESVLPPENVENIVQMAEKDLEHQVATASKDTITTQSKETKTTQHPKISTKDYVDPITQDYIVERSNLIAINTFLVPEVWGKKDIEHNLRLH